MPLDIPYLPPSQQDILQQTQSYLDWQKWMYANADKVYNEFKFWYGESVPWAYADDATAKEAWNRWLRLMATGIPQNAQEATELRQLYFSLEEVEKMGSYLPVYNQYYGTGGTGAERLAKVRTAIKEGFTTPGQWGQWLQSGEEAGIETPKYTRLLAEEQNLGLIPGRAGTGVTTTTVAPLGAGVTTPVTSVTPYAPGQTAPVLTSPGAQPKNVATYADFYNLGYTYIKNKYPQISDVEIAQALSNIWAAHGTQLAGSTIEQLQQFLQNPAVQAAITPANIKAAAGTVGSMASPSTTRTGFYGETEYTPEEIQQFKYGRIGGVQWEDLYRKMQLRRQARYGERGGAAYQRTQSGELALAGKDLSEY